MLKLQAEPRMVFGKQLKKERQAGKLPVIAYGSKEKSLPLFVSLKDFKKILAEAGESTLITLETKDGGKDVLIHDVATDPVSDEPVHADFYFVDKTRKVEVSVPLKFVGVAPAIREQGGILIKVLHELEVETLPHEIPHELEVDISGLVDLEDQVQVKDIKLPEGVVSVNKPEEVVAAISTAVPEEEVVVPAVDLSSIEVEKKGKQETEDGAPAEGAAPPSATEAKKE